MVKRIQKKSPQEAYRQLKKLFPVAYIKHDGCVTYKGFDISSLDVGNEIAEVILVNDAPVQVRNLKDNPYWSDAFQFGGF